MTGLIPRDHWEHGLADLFCGLAAASAARKHSDEISLPGLGACIPVQSGRAGLVAAIKALRLRPGSRIGVPLYCCNVVFQAITAAGCAPRFIDIDPATFCISPQDVFVKRSGIEAVVAVHMFGNLCDMTGLRDAAEGKPIIEDCAQALGSRILDRPAGSFGTVAFFSFRSGKYISAGEGGAVFSGDAGIRSRLSQLITEMTGPGYADEFGHAAKNYIKSVLRSRPFYGIAGYPLWMSFNNRIPAAERSSIALSRIYATDYVIIRKRLLLLESAIKRQRANAAFYTCSLTVEPGMVCLEKPGTFYNRYLYPLSFPSADHRDFIADYLFSRKIDTMKYVDDVVAVAAKRYGYSGDCPVSERLSKRVLIIPSYYSLRKRDVERIAESLNTGWKKIAKRSVGNGNS